MKLNYKRTICVGFAFFLICAFWQAYDNTIPMILTNKFGMSQTWSGFIMALDNILALFLLPLFGAISDKCRSKLGRRTPFILIGTLVAAVALIALSFVDNMQLNQISAVSAIDDPNALQLIYQTESDKDLITPDGDHFVLSEYFTEDEFSAITSQIEVNGELSTNDAYTNYVVPARQAYAWQATAESPATLIFFVVLLLIILVSMSTFRSPAVALMPDVTMKPLRSKANAIINLMGSAGGVLVLAVGVIFSTSAVSNSLMSYTTYFSVVAAIMLIALIIFMVTVREPQFVREMQEESIKYSIEDTDEINDSQISKSGLSKEEKRSFLFILASIVFWFMGYNAITSKYSVYASNILHKDYNMTLIVAQIAAIIAYLPVGIIASKLGRKRTIMAGVFLLTAAFFLGIFMTSSSPSLLMNLLFALAGIAWATINVNSFPMVVEMCSGSEVGKYTGYYYTASMGAQVVTPILSGYVMDKMGMTSLFPYASIFVAISFFTMIFVKHGDSKPIAKTGLDALSEMDAD